MNGEFRAEQDNDSKTCAVTLTTKQMGLQVHAFTVTLSDTQPVYTYNISYELNGGTNAAGNPSTYIKGTGVASLAAPTRTGYTFGGWYDNAGFQGDAVTSIPTTATGDVTLYAKWTANTYTVAYDANGGSGTMDSQTFTYDAAQNLRTNTFTNTGKLFDGWKDNNNNSYSASQSVSNLTATNGATVTLYAQWKTDPGHITGTGTASDPYVISSMTQWETFATESNAATYWASGVYIKLGANITGVTTTVGTQTHPFQGTFDGQGYTLAVTISETSTQGTAPFREISGATIKHLTVTGSVTGTTHAAGLVGFSRSGSNTIEDCNISASVTVNTGSNKHCGGLVGHAVTSTLTIRNSIYSGTISNGGNYAGGLQGWSDGNTLNIENSLFSGSYQGGGTFHPIAIRNGNATMSGTIN